MRKTYVQPVRERNLPADELLVPSKSLYAPPDASDYRCQTVTDHLKNDISIKRSFNGQCSMFKAE